jgi:outer membrane immunogenic protein
MVFQYDSGILLLYSNSKAPAVAVDSLRRWWGQAMKIAWARGIGAGLAACAAAGSACAADLAIPPPAPPPVAAPVAMPVYHWSGFFVGGHLGYGWGSEAVTLTSNGNYPGGITIPAVIAADPRGFVGGVQYGTNWQFDRVVLGTESDFSFTDIRRSQTIVTSSPTITNTGEQKLPWFGTTRVRAGYTIQDNLLIYATGGLANGRAEASFSAFGPGVGSAGSRSKSLWGWSLGGGLEYGVGPWSAKIEYLHYDIGTLTFYALDSVTSGAVTRVSTKFAGDMVRVGVDYRFAWTPWQLIFGR